MKFDLSDEIQSLKAIARWKYLIEKGCKIELVEIRDTRSQAQNRALHLYFTMISEQLNELGLEFQYTGLKGSAISLMYTPELVKNMVWRPIQIALFDIESTTKINTKQINQIIDILTKFFGERGVSIEFPSFESLMNES